MSSEVTEGTERSALETERSALEAEKSALDVKKREIEAERSALEAEKSALAAKNSTQPSAVEVKSKCTKCGLVVYKKGTFAHWKEVHKDMGKWDDVKDTLYEDIEVQVPPPPHTKTPPEEKGESVYRGEVDEKELLHKILDNDPDLSQKHIDEVIRWSEFSKIDPFSLTHLLTTMKDVKQSTATRIGFKYQAALSTAKGQGPLSYPLFVSTFQREGAGTSVPSSFLTGSSQGQDHGETAASRGPSKEDIREIIKSQNMERELEVAKEKLKALGKGGNTPNEGRALTAEDFERMMDERRKKEKSEEEKNTLAQTLNSIGRTLETLNTRVSTMEHGEMSEGPGKKKEGSLTKEDIAEIIEERGKKSGGELSEERILQLVDERNQKKRGEEEKTAIIQTLNGIRLALDNLNTRVSSVEQGGVPRKEGESTDKKMLDVAVNRYIQLMKEGELTEDKVISIAKAVAPKPTSPPGTRNQYDMEVEKATHEADARKIEAQEHRKGFEAIASGIRDGLGSVGWNIGAGAAGGSPRSGPSPEAQTEVRMPTSEPQPMEWRDGLWYTRCVYSDCRATMAFEDGKSTVMCPTCRRVIQVQPTEEELRKKVSTEKRTETKVEVKKEEPKREEPQREEPQREEEKPPEAEKPESIEEKPSAEAKPEEKPPEGAEGAEPPKEKKPEDEK